MDASKLIGTQGNHKWGVSNCQAARIAIANDLRDLADDIESGRRIVQELQTIEHVKPDDWPSSVLVMKTALYKAPGAKP